MNFAPNSQGTMAENIAKGLTLGAGILAGGYGLNEVRKWLVKKLRPQVFEEEDEETGFYFEKESQDKSGLYGTLGWGASAVLGAYGLKQAINFLKEKEEQYIAQGLIDEINRKQKNIYTQALGLSKDAELSGLLDEYLDYGQGMEKKAILPILLGNLAGVAALAGGGYLAYDALKDSDTAKTISNTLGDLYKKFPEVYGATLGAIGTTAALAGYHGMNHYLGEKPYTDYLNVPKLEYREMTDEEKKKFRQKLNRPEPINKVGSKKKVAQSALPPPEDLSKKYDWDSKKSILFPENGKDNVEEQLKIIMEGQGLKPTDFAYLPLSGIQNKLFGNVPNNVKDKFYSGHMQLWDSDLENLAQKKFSNNSELETQRIDELKPLMIGKTNEQKREILKQHGIPTEKNWMPLIDSRAMDAVENSFSKDQFVSGTQGAMEVVNDQLKETKKELNKMVTDMPSTLMKGFMENPKNMGMMAGLGGIFNAAPMAANAFGQYNLVQQQKQTNKLMEEQNEMLRKGKPKTLMELSRMEHNG